MEERYVTQASFNFKPWPCVTLSFLTTETAVRGLLASPRQGALEDNRHQDCVRGLQLIIQSSATG